MNPFFLLIFDSFGVRQLLYAGEPVHRTGSLLTFDEPERECVSPWEKGRDLDARKIAKSKGLQLIGTVGVLLLAKENSLIFSVKDVMDELIANGMWISQRFYLEVLAIALEK